MWLYSGLRHLNCPCSVWGIISAKHAAVTQEPEHAVVVAYVSDRDPWSSSMRNSTLACELLLTFIPRFLHIDNCLIPILSLLVV